MLVVRSAESSAPWWRVAPSGVRWLAISSSSSRSVIPTLGSGVTRPTYRRGGRDRYQPVTNRRGARVTPAVAARSAGAAPHEGHTAHDLAASAMPDVLLIIGPGAAAGAAPHEGHTAHDLAPSATPDVLLIIGPGAAARSAGAAPH